MVGELYQLVAIDNDGKERIIVLNNDNKTNKGFLNFIDSGTTYMQSEEALIDYLMKKGKIDSSDVKLAIKYNNRGVRYLPIIYNDPEFRFVSLNADDKTKLKHYAQYLIEKIDFELCNSNFYQNILFLNSEIFSQISNGNYLDDYILNKLRKYYEAYGVLYEDMSNKQQYKDDLAKSLKTYKTIRTLYIFYKIHLNFKQTNKQENTSYDIPERLKYIMPNYQEEKLREIPDEIQKSYEDKGMDGVWATVNSDEILDKGYKFK